MNGTPGIPVPKERGGVKTAGPALRRPIRALRRVLRSPRTIVFEVGAVTVAGILIAVVPQTAVVGAEQLARFQASHPTLAPLLAAAGLHAISGSLPFTVLFLVASASLGIAIGEQWRRAWREATLPLGPESFRVATYRHEGERQCSQGAVPAAPALFSTTGRLGLFGSPVFHAGLLTLVLAGLLRMLFAQTAAVDLFEGETLAPVASAYGAQWGGPLARPFALPFPLRLDGLASERWPTGDLKSFAARLTLETPAGPRPERVAVNAPLDLGAEHVFLSALHGPAALLEANGPEGSERVAALLRPVAGRANAFLGTVTLRSGIEVRLRAALRPDGGPPRALNARLLADGALLFAGPLAPGASVSLGERGTLAVPAIRSWAQFRGSRDRALALVYLGFALVTAGALAMFAVVRVDTAVLVTPLGNGREHVVVAMRTQRLAPLFADRFAALAREHLGTETARSPRPGASPLPVILLLGAGLAQGCGSGGRLTDERAAQLVRTYNQRLIDAYRSSDPEMLEGIAGPAECKKVLGLIGVKSDQGVSLDATLVSFAVRAVARPSAATMLVTTDETWRYADRQIGSGNVIGQPSEDHYRMSYHLERLPTGAWVIGAVSFASPPVVGRASALSQVPIAAHGLPATEPVPSTEK